MKKILCLILVLTGSLTLQAQQEDEHDAEVSKRLEIFNNMMRQLDLYYVDTLDVKKMTEDATLYMLSQLDPFTTYYSEDHTKDLKQMTTGKYAGIGSMISYHAKSDRCVIADPYDGMPAAKAGLRMGDIILSIDGVDMGVCGKQPKADYSSKVSEALRGKPGTTFELVVKRPYVADTMKFKLTRASVELPSVSYSGMLSDSVGYLQLESYTENTSRDVRQHFEKLKEQGAKRLLLDLRGNGGGLLTEAVNVVNLFIPRGQLVVDIKGKRKEMNETYKTRKSPWDTEIPLVVLTDFGTASSAEITSGALQDYDRAVIVGQRTYGKGLVQQSRPLRYGTILKLTTCKYYIPSGRCIQAYEFDQGRPKHLPDSLSKEFRTAAGRIVRDGGGITPDVIAKTDTMPDMVDQLELSQALFNYVVKYRNTHATIASPEKFAITDQEYEDFKAFLKEEKFTYDSQSRRVLELLKEVARSEGYSEVAKQEMEALEAKLIHNEEHDFKYWEDIIREVVNIHIVRNYYFAEGSIRHNNLYDKEVKLALEVLCDTQRYREILSAPKKK